MKPRCGAANSAHAMAMIITALTIVTRLYSRSSPRLRRIMLRLKNAPAKSTPRIAWIPSADRSSPIEVCNGRKQTEALAQKCCPTALLLWLKLGDESPAPALPLPPSPMLVRTAQSVPLLRTLVDIRKRRLACARVARRQLWQLPTRHRRPLRVPVAQMDCFARLAMTTEGGAA